MAVICLGSVAGAPGTTSLAVALAAAWPRRCLVVDADPDGGRIAARLDLAVRPGLTELAAASRSGLADPDDVWRFAQVSPLGLEVVPAHPSAEQVASALRAAADRVADVLARLDADVLIDVGRYRPASPASTLAHAADRRLVVSGSRLEDAVALRHRADLLDGLGGADVVVCGDGEHSAADLARALGAPVLSSRPTRRARRLGARSLRREERWVTDLAHRLAGQSAADCVAEPDVLSGAFLAEASGIDESSDELDGAVSGRVVAPRRRRSAALAVDGAEWVAP